MAIHGYPMPEFSVARCPTMCPVTGPSTEANGARCDSSFSQMQSKPTRLPRSRCSYGMGSMGIMGIMEKE